VLQLYRPGRGRLVLVAGGWLRFVAGCTWGHAGFGAAFLFWLGEPWKLVGVVWSVVGHFGGLGNADGVRLYGCDAVEVVYRRKEKEPRTSWSEVDQSSVTSAIGDEPSCE
jgi:hypothetical protein